MTAQIKKDNGTITISVDGRIDTATSRELESIVNREIRNCTKLIFDFEKLEYISSAGLRILLGAQKLMGRNGMKVINVNENVYEIFEVTGFSLILNIKRI